MWREGCGAEGIESDTPLATCVKVASSPPFLPSYHLRLLLSLPSPFASSPASLPPLPPFLPPKPLLLLSRPVFPSLSSSVSLHVSRTSPSSPIPHLSYTDCTHKSLTSHFSHFPLISNPPCLCFDCTHKSLTYRRCVHQSETLSTFVSGWAINCIQKQPMWGGLLACWYQAPSDAAQVFLLTHARTHAHTHAHTHARAGTYTHRPV